MKQIRTKSIDRVISFEIGVILALLLVHWFMNLSYSTAVVLEDTVEEEEVFWSGKVYLEEEEQEESKVQTQEKMELIQTGTEGLITALISRLYFLAKS